ncbi:ESPR-type extended signal peptide-containing protein [uncultured Megasphaera sp.]|uniref:ESPR-type extended signal peptide-containing protein n=1 Tax=uncultured Megasphaera sp. TaxID=165188 RepID=UPI00262A3420|nr:ESPR-type extended signal peptide-containing protein [uncultured Megasphaera sp.]
MNKIYKVIYSKVRNCYVVVSELAKSHGKERSQRMHSGSRIAALTLAITLCLSSYALAADPVDLGNGGTATYDAQGNLIIGKDTVAEGTKAQGQNNTTIGTNSDTLRNVTEGETTKNGQPMDKDNTQLVSNEGKAADLTTSTESGGSTAVGYNNHAEGDNSTAIGNGAKITNKPITYYADADGNKTTDAEKATWYKDKDGKPTQVPQVFRDGDGNKTATPQYVHTYTEKDPDTGKEITKTEITSDASKADQKDGKPVYSYQKSDNADHLYSVTLYQSADNSIAAGTNVTANGSNAVAVGYNSTADNSAVAIGDTAVAKENTVAIGKDTKAVVDGAIALGMDSQADRSGGVTGWDPKTGTTSTKSDVAWQSGAGALSIGNGGVSRQIMNVAAGSEDSDAVNLAQLKEAMTHYYSVKTTEATDKAGNNNYLNDGATGDNALAAGVSAVAAGNNATAVGTQTYASGEEASAYGYRAAAMGKDSVSIGSGTSAQQEGSIAIGGHAQGDHAVQVGTNSTAQSAYSVAVGGHAKGDHSVEVGYGSTAQGSYSASVGGHASGDYSIAIGSSKNDWGDINPATAGGDNSIAIGGHTNSANDIAIGAGSGTSGGHAIAVGGFATSSQAVSIGGVAGSSQATAVGSNSSATGAYSTAVGGHAGDTNSTAVGQGANATYAYATAVGNSSTASGPNSTALGYGTFAQGSNSTAIGGASAKGTNVTAIGKNSTVGGYWSDSISDSTVIGGAHISESLTSGTAIGSNASVTGSYGVALGQNASVAYRSTGVGTETKASNTGTAVGYGAQSSGYQSAAVGAGSMATGQNAVSLGGGGAWGDYSIALGSGAGTTAHAIALGQNSGAWGENAIAIGEGTNAWRANSIVLGKNSKSGADKNVEGYDPLTGMASEDKSAAWYSTDEAVSFGRAEERDDDDNITASAITRQLNNVAAGTLDTDAVNVAQLKASGFKVTAGKDEEQASTIRMGDTLDFEGEDNAIIATSKDSQTITVKVSMDPVFNSVTADKARMGYSPEGVLDTVQNGQPTGGHAKGGDYVTGLTNKEWTVKDPTYVSGRAATEDELRIVSDAVSGNITTIENNTKIINKNTETINSGLSFTTNTKDAANTTENYKGYKVVKRSLGDTIAIKASDETGGHSYSTSNLTTRIAENGDISILMDETPAFTTVTTGDIIFKGNPDKKDQDDKAAQADTSVHYGDKTLTDGKNITTSDNETKSTRLGYQDAQGLRHDIATMDDGQIYAGDIKADGTADNTGFVRTMNQKTTINGGVKETGKLTEGNIGVVSNGTDTLTVKLAKDLKNLTSVTTGKTVMDDSGIKITNDAADETKNVVINGDKISYGGNQVTNMGSGADGTADGKPTYNTDTNGANIGDVKNIASSTVQPVIDTVNKGWELEVDGTKRKDVTPNSRVVNLAAGQNIELGGTGDTVTIATADDVRFNTVRTGGDADGQGGYTGGIVIGKQSGGGSANPDENDYITGLKNINWDSTKIQSGRAATEDQLKKVAEDIKQGTVSGDVYVTGGEVSYHTDGGTDNGQPTVNDGTGKLSLTENNKTTKIEITGLHDYYATGGSVTADGKTLEITRNDRDEKGNPQKISIDLSNVLKNDLRLVQNPAAGTNGKYTVAQDGTVTLKVQNADGTVSNDITIGGFEGVAKGLDFDANTRTTTDGKVHNVKMGGTIKVQGIDPVSGHTYSADNVTTEVDDSGNITIKLDKDLTANTVTVGQAGKAGENGAAGSIGINGKDGKDGITTTLIRTEKGQPGKDGTNGKPGVDGTDITRIVYQNGQDGTDGNDIHTVATLEDGLKFAGDDGQNDTTKVISKKLNEQLDIIGGAALNSLTDNNIGVKNKDGKLYVRLAKHVDLDADGTLKAGTATIGSFSNTQLTTNKKNHAPEGSYATGLSNTEWSVADPEYVSGRAATEDQLKVVSDAIHNRQLVNTDYQLVANPDPTTDGSYTATNGELTLTVRDTEHTNDPKYPDKTITIKDIASKTKVDEAYDRTVKYDMKDGKVDKTHVTFEAVDEAGNSVDTQVSHMASGASEIKMDEKGRPISYVYDIDNNGANIGDVKNIAKSLDEEVTKRGLDFRGNDGKTVHRDLGTLLNLTGGLKDQDELAQATGKNLGVRQNGDQDGLEIVMTDTPDFTKVTVGEGTDTNSKITIGNQTVTGKKSDGSTADQPQTGNYITGLDNKAWDKDNIVENRAATEGQLSQAIGEIKGAEKGGFGLADETGNTVKKDLGGTIAVKGDGNNIQTKVKDGGLEISLNKDVDLGTDGSVNAGNTTIDKDGVNTNEVKVGDITINDNGINGGAKQITNIASGIDGKQYADAGDNNAASIGDVKQLARNEAKASEARSGKNITVKDNHTVNLNDHITLGDDGDKAKQVDIDGKGAKITAGDGANKITMDGTNGQVTIGSGDKTLTLGQQANGAGDNNPATGNFLNGLDNRNWDGEHIQNGRAATEDQLKTVSDKVDSGRVFQGDDGQNVTVGLGDTLKIQGGAKDVSSDNNIGIVKGADDTLNVRLAKDLTGLNSVTTGNTTINNGGLNVKTGDSTHQDITIQQGDVNMGGNKIEGVAPGKISKDSTDAVNGSQLYAADQAISYLGGTVNKLGTRVDRVGAGSAALAALHPLDFDPDDKWDFAAGYGHYRGANAAAVGAYYRPNEDTMFSIGGSFGGGENMFNAGVSIKLGQGNHISTSRVAMAKEMEAMRRHMAEQDALIAKLESMHGMAEGPEKSALFPDVAENHWAYQYVTTLAKKGILEGYPDGEFKGDRMMTRYEFAAIVYRIVESGVGSTDPELSKLVREFSPELQYIRIDTIHRDHNGQPTVQRVRVKDRK